MEKKNMTIHLKIWRQKDSQSKGKSGPIYG